MTPTSRPAGTLIQPLAGVFGVAADALDVSLLYRGNLVDSTSVYLIGKGRGTRLGVALWSPDAAPLTVASGMAKAGEAAALLSPTLRSRVLLPLAQGWAQGRSYAVVPYCKPLATARPVWWLQRPTVRRFVLDWLEDVVRDTAYEPEGSEVEAAFGKPLARLAGFEPASERVRAAARTALQRLEAGVWVPRHVLMHADLWQGNVLVRAAGPRAPAGWQERLCLIDWAASEARGHAMFDLMRAIRAFKVAPDEARRAVARHCELLGCDGQDAASHLAGALACLLGKLEHFPVPRFASMAAQCMDTMDALVAPVPVRARAVA